MRELNECAAEVFRRSEQRIKQRRRKRTRALAVCIPICLIVTIWSAMNLPAMVPAGETSDQVPPNGETVGNVPASLDCPYTAVEIQDAGLFPEEHSGRVTDAAAVAEMYRSIHSLFTEIGGNGQEASENFLTDADNTNYFQNESESTSRLKSCTITFTAEDGSQAVYHLSGNTLVNVNENKTIFLSDFQIAELLTVFGISE